MFYKVGGRRFEESLRSILAKDGPEWDLSYELAEAWTWRESKVKGPRHGQRRRD